MDRRVTVVPCVFYKHPIPATRWLEKASGLRLRTSLVEADRG